ncbi:hypothetical protein [Alkalinema sp. FACHB-956]|uniref:hypothetical protein n=1 Tax=Alkalinema sp. FACHB-956 TaxID=2692768 RepID=UPI001687171F|nr:hypothetical protein [Alkalinema sp. FACHB-956]MBD2328777.1 hypothetical protein [Alkalinema sp. FACHB-956]
MALRLANDSDCIFFQFWLDDRAYDGVNCQGEIFVQLQVFSSQRKDQAYELGSELSDQEYSVVIVKTKDNYIVGTAVQGQDWRQQTSIQKLLQNS